MEVVILGVSGKADSAKNTAAPHFFAGPNGNGPSCQVAILRLPTIAMIDDKAIAALLPGHGVRPARSHRFVWNAVTDAQHSSSRRGYYRNTAPLIVHAQKPDVSAIVTIIGATAARIIGGTWAGIMIDIVLDRAIPPKITSRRERQA